MAGRPITRKMFADIKELGGEDWLLGEIRMGRTCKSIAEQLGVSMNLLREWRDAEPGRRERWDQAITDGKEWRAEDYADKAISILENCKAVTSAEASIAKELSKRYAWIAQTFDRATYGDQQNINVDVNPSEAWQDLGQMIVDNLRATASAKPIEAEDADFELLEDEEDEALRLEGTGGASE